MLPIRITGDSVLHSPAAEVGQIDDRIRELVVDMYDTMAAAPGVGLAAPQVGVPLRLFVFDWSDEDGRRFRGTAINPTLLISPPPLGEPDEEDDAEGCLSVPGERFPLLRSHSALLRATDVGGNGYESEASGWLARIWQHEFDHLDGALYVDRLAAPERKAALKSIRKHGWGSEGQTWMPGVDELES